MKLIRIIQNVLPSRLGFASAFLSGGLSLTCAFSTLGDPIFTDATLSAGFNGMGFNFGAPIWGDFNNDGNLDLFVDNYFREPPYLYQNQGDGTFTDIFPTSGINGRGDRQGSAWFDFDNDGDLDLSCIKGASGGTTLRPPRDRRVSLLPLRKTWPSAVSRANESLNSRKKSVVKRLARRDKDADARNARYEQLRHQIDDYYAVKSPWTVDDSELEGTLFRLMGAEVAIWQLCDNLKQRNDENYSTASAVSTRLHEEFLNTAERALAQIKAQTALNGHPHRCVLEPRL